MEGMEGAERRVCTNVCDLSIDEASLPADFGFGLVGRSKCSGLNGGSKLTADAARSVIGLSLVLMVLALPGGLRDLSTVPLGVG